MIVSVLFFALQGQMAAEDLRFNVQLATSARGELELIDRLKALRTATEKLPENWKSSVFKDSSGADKFLTKQGLIQEIENMEMLAADRWAVIVENTALIDVGDAKLDSRGKEMRAKITQLPDLHLDLNQKLDAFNKRMKDGILLSLTKDLVR